MNLPNKIKIRVLKKDAKKDYHGCILTDCPTAIAIRRAVPEATKVKVAYVNSYINGVTYRNPPELIHEIKLFTTSGERVPFAGTYTLTRQI